MASDPGRVTTRPLHPRLSTSGLASGTEPDAQAPPRRLDQRGVDTALGLVSRPRPLDECQEALVRTQRYRLALSFTATTPLPPPYQGGEPSHRFPSSLRRGEEVVTNRLSREATPPMPAGSNPASSRPPASKNARSNSVSFLKAAAHGDASVPRRRLAARPLARTLLASRAPVAEAGGRSREGFAVEKQEQCRPRSWVWCSNRRDRSF